jgi:hypothetical protein
MQQSNTSGGGGDTDAAAASPDVDRYNKLLDARRAFVNRGRRVLDAPPVVRACFGNVVALIEKHTRAADATLQQFVERKSPDLVKALKDLADGSSELRHHLFDFDKFYGDGGNFNLRRAEEREPKLAHDAKVDDLSGGGKDYARKMRSIAVPAFQSPKE